MTARTTDFNPADLDTLAEALQSGGVKYVAFDPVDMELPGVWINVTGFAHDLLAGLTVKTELICLAANSDPRTALTQIAPLYNRVTAALAAFGGPTSDPVTGVWQIPGAPRLPGISIPFEMLTTQEPE